LSFCDRTNVLAGLSANGKTPIVISERSDPTFQVLPKMWQVLRRHAYGRCSMIVTQTDAAADFFDSYPVPRIVIPSAVDPPPLSSDREIAVANQQIISVGRLATEKGFDQLIAAFAVVHRQYPGWKLRIVGEGPCRSSLQDQVQRLQLTDVVSMPGWIRSVWDELAASTLFVLPSHYEGFPSALLEAMAAGVPSIALEIQSGSRDIIRSGVNGILASGDTASMAQAITTLIADDELREQLGKAGKSVVDDFSWESMVDQYETVLRSVANSPDALD
jgi:glycosyltransferase involved in cell wall biosynthesis